MNDYFQETKFIVNLLYFYYQGSRYQGRGVMTRTPDEGFHLEAFLDDQIKSIEKFELGKVKIAQKNDFCLIRMRPQGYDWAIAPNICLSSQDKLSITQSKYLSITFGRLVFCESVSSTSDDSLWTGYALYQTKSNLSLSDIVHTERRINNQEIGRKSEFSGICYEDENQRKLIGHFVDDRQLKLYWEIPKTFLSKADTWKWNIAIQDALSIYFGEIIHLLQREFIRGTQKITEVRQQIELSELGLLSPFYGLRFDNLKFITLTDFFISNPLSKADICRRIFWQLIEASNQQSRQAQELLLSTILEAALRSVDNHPFKTGDNSWNVGKSLEKFINDYLPSNEQTDKKRKEQQINMKSKIMKEHSYLRDRNAHPDWLFSQGGNLSEEEQVKSLDSMIFLSRFYGYMILALAGFKDFHPDFPEPHQTWNAAATIIRSSSLDSEDTFADLMEGEMSDLTDKLKKAKTYYEKIIIWRNFKRDI